MAITEISVSKIYILATEPTNKVKDRFWFDTTNNLLKRYDGTSWKPISVSSDDVVVLSSGNKVSLTNYLNTQIATLAEGIDSKQDKLKYYSEQLGGVAEAKIQTEMGHIGIKSNTTINATNSVNIDSYNGDTNIGTKKYDNINVTTQSNLALKSTGLTLDLNKTDSSDYSNIINIDSNLLTIDTTDTEITTLSGSLISNSISSNSSDYKLPTEKAVYDVVSGKQDKLTFYHEETSTNQEASIAGVDSFSILSTNKGLILDGNNGGITIKHGHFNSGQAVISLEVNTWEDGSDAILFDVDGQAIKISDALLISEIKNKQNSTSTALNTTDKTIVGAINELLASINTNVITSTEQKRITTTSTSAGIQMSTTAKACMVSINPVKTNVGAIYISTSSDTAPTINPLYPDQMPKYKFPDASQVYIWSDVNGDSVDLTIEYYG